MGVTVGWKCCATPRPRASPGRCASTRSCARTQSHPGSDRPSPSCVDSTGSPGERTPAAGLCRQPCASQRDVEIRLEGGQGRGLVAGALRACGRVAAGADAGLGSEGWLDAGGGVACDVLAECAESSVAAQSAIAGAPATTLHESRRFIPGQDTRRFAPIRAHRWAFARIGRWHRTMPG